MTSPNYKPFFFGTAVIVAAALVVYLLASEAGRVHQDTCVGITQVAGDEEKMNYVKSWLASRLGDHEFINELRRSRFFDRGDPRLHTYLDLNWAYLGFAPEYASLAFNVRNTDMGDFTASDIGSVSIGQGRSKIIVRLNDSKDFGLHWRAEDLSQLRAVGDDVFVYCGS